MTGGEGHVHVFDPISGWCAHCNLREDGRLLGKGGEVYQSGRGYTAAELDHIRKHIQGVHA